MKNGKGRKLTLSRETLHRLEPDALSKAAGGNITTPITPNCTATCQTCATCFSNCTCIVSMCICSVPILTCA